MKYKQVFLIWLLADIFLAIGLLCFLLYQFVTHTGSSNDWEMFFAVLLYGTAISLPSLLAMLLFHALFTNFAKDATQYRLPYIALIITINILYLLIGQYAFGMTPEFNIFYIGSTAAGLLAFYIIDRKIKKTTTIPQQQI